MRTLFLRNEVRTSCNERISELSEHAAAGRILGPESDCWKTKHNISERQERGHPVNARGKVIDK